MNEFSKPTGQSTKSAVRLATFADLTADLVWPKLLRAGPLGLAPTRVMLGLVFVIGAGLLIGLASVVDASAGWIAGAVAGGKSVGFTMPTESPVRSMLRQTGLELASAVTAWNTPREAGPELLRALVTTPATAVGSHVWAMLIVLPLLGLWTAVMGGAICRSVASEYALGKSIGWTAALGFARSSAVSLLMALWGPLGLVWALVLCFAGLGLIMRIPGFDAIAGLLWVGVLVGGIIAAIVMVVWVLGGSMLVPAVACESADAVDAVQRAYSYVLAKPLRLVVYSALLLAQIVIVLAAAGLIATLAIRTGEAGVTAWGGERAARVSMTQGSGNWLWPGFAPSGVNESQAGSAAVGRAGVAFWTTMLMIMVAGVGVSVFWSSATLLYLAMRRIVDGQDMTELWSPGIVGGTMAQSMAFRASVAESSRSGVQASAPDVVGDADGG